MVPGLAGGKMTSSDPNSKINFLDSPGIVKKELRAAICEEGNVDENGVLAFVGAVLIAISQLRLLRQQSGKLKPGLGDQRPFVSDDFCDI
jgi:tyrosyl-tRNA synthetase